MTFEPADADAAALSDATHRRTLAKIKQLESLAAAVRSPRPLDAVLDLVITQISDVVPTDATAVWLYDSENDLWYIGGARGLTRRASQITFKSGQTLHATVGDQGEIVSNLESVGFRRLYPEHDLVRCALYAPMKVAGRRVGLIALYRNSGSAFDADDLKFVRTVGSHVGMAVSFAALEARAQRMAVLDERARLGADLHDGILQILASVRVYAGELRSSLEPVRGSLDEDASVAVYTTLSRLEDCVDSGSAEVTAAIQHLRTPDASLDLTRQLDVTRDRLEERGFVTNVNCEAPDMAPEVADALAWIAREAASNVLQHSGGDRVKVEVRPVGTYVEMTISDNGVGRGSTNRPRSEVDGRPLGQSIMRERAEQIGGMLQVTGSSTGTTVWARVPAVPFQQDGAAAPVAR